MATNIRWATRRALVTALNNADPLTGIDKHRGWPGEVMEREAIWLGATTGSLTVPVFTGPDTDTYPVNYDDVFTIPVHLVAGAPGQTLDEGEDRLEVMYLAVEHVARTDPQLAALDGLVHVLLADLTIESMATKEGFASFADLNLRCKSRISGGAA